jgi:hypothetical protein
VTVLGAHLLNETAQVSRSTNVSNGSGGWTETVGPPSAVPCRVRAWTTEEQLVARQAGVRVGWVMYVKPDADVRRGDVVSVRGFTAQVRSVRMPSVPHHKVVDLDERQT